MGKVGCCSILNWRQTEYLFVLWSKSPICEHGIGQYNLLKPDDATQFGKTRCRTITFTNTSRCKSRKIHLQFNSNGPELAYNKTWNINQLLIGPNQTSWLFSPPDVSHAYITPAQEAHWRQTPTWRDHVTRLRQMPTSNATLLPPTRSEGTHFALVNDGLL